MALSAGNVIEIAAEDSWVEQTVEWEQAFRDYQEQYFRAAFNNKNPAANEKQSAILISKEMVDTLKSKGRTLATGELKVTVDADFQYGQRGEGIGRFLVFHDKSRNIFQHRFISGMLRTPANEATKIFQDLGYIQVDDTSRLVFTALGDRLKNF